MRAAIYARVSSARQRDQHTIESQLRDAPAYARAQGWEVVGTYVDDGKSAKAGQLEKRDGFARLIADAKASRFDVVVVVAVDRLTRSEDPVERATVVAMIGAAGAKLAIVGAGIQDPRTFAGDTYITLQALFAAEENRRRSERARAGHVTAAARGHLPAGCPPFGLAYDPGTGSWTEHPERAAVVREIYARVTAGESAGVIARDLTDRGVPRPRSSTWRREKVWAIVRSPAYRGTWRLRSGRSISVPALVADADWYAAQDRLEAAQRRGIPRARYTYLLETLALCGLCGARISVRAGHAGYPSTYVCSCRITPRRRSAPCSLPRHPVADVDARVWHAVAGALADPSHVARALAHLRSRSADVEAWQADLADAERRLARLDATVAVVLARFRRGSISEAALDVELAAVDRERAALRRQADTARAAAAGRGLEVERADAIEATVEHLRRALTRIDTPEERQAAVRAVVPVGGAVLEPDGTATVDVIAGLSRPPPFSVQNGDTLPTLQIARLRVVSAGR